jgi:DNA-binding NarL/FixJ family response regulator
MVLVVDDSPIDRTIIGGVLERQADVDWLVEFAGNGVEALTKMRDLLPDVVVTDLQMPEMNGLDLVTAIGATYPSVPVILITGKGSESIAMEALDKGAASYVPKSRLVDRLMGTIEQVLATGRAEHGQRRVSECVTDARLTLRLENDPTIIRPLAEYLQGVLEDMKFCDQAARVQVAIALEEAVFNAMFHGNLELPSEDVRQARSHRNRDAFVESVEQRRAEPPYRDRTVEVEAQLAPSEARFVIRDGGPGFALDDIPDRGDPRTLSQSTGRGLVLMRNFMDQVTYNQSRNEVTLVKRAPEVGEDSA